MMQQTLKLPVEMNGVGLHSGQDITLVISPASAGHGIIFKRTDVPADKNPLIPALWNYVIDTQLCTVIGNSHGVSVGTIEHIMSALRGCGVDNALIALNGAEVPVMDGSAIPFVEAIETVGLKQQDKPRRSIRILKEISVEKDGKRVTLSPAEVSTFGGEINFDHPVIKTQSFNVDLLNGNFRHDIAEARTFGFLHEVEWMRSQGLAQGGSMDNAIVLDKDSVMNKGGLRFDDEFIRHKLLDAIGDLYLAGHQIIGAYDSSKAGHEMNNLILHALFQDQSAYEVVSDTLRAQNTVEQGDEAGSFVSA